MYQGEKVRREKNARTERRDKRFCRLYTSVRYKMHTRFPTSSESQLILETMSGLATLKTLSNHMIHAPFNTQKEQGTCHVPQGLDPHEPSINGSSIIQSSDTMRD